MNKYELKEVLQNGIVSVVFEKVDGTIREMNCTLNKEHMPPQLLTEEQNAANFAQKSLDPKKRETFLLPLLYEYLHQQQMLLTSSHLLQCEP